MAHAGTRARTGSVRDVTFALLRELGVTTVFGNPGSTELRFLAGWPADFRYVMALHEGSAVAMADAYAQVSGNAAFVNLHSAGGVGNAMGTLFTAFRNQAPLVVLAGQQTRAMLRDEPFLFAEDATALPRPYVKWACEPARAEDVPAAIAHAYYAAMQRPCGPAFVSIPESDWEATTAYVGARRIDGDAAAGDPVLRPLAQRLGSARSPALVAGAGADRAGAVSAVVALAERLGAPVFASALTGRCGFPEDHALFAGPLPRVRSGVADALRAHDVVLVIGAPVFNYHIHAGGAYADDATAIVQLTDDPAAAAAAVTGESIVGAIRPAVERLAELTPQRVRSAPRDGTRAPDAPPAGTVEAVLAAIRATLPHDAILVEEAPTANGALHAAALLQPGRYFSAASGSLGYGLPAAAGAALAAPGKRIVALIGDGSAHYGIVGLWTAVEHALPITYVIVNNAGYDALNAFAGVMDARGAPSFAIGHVDFAALARGYGAAAERIDDTGALRAALERSFRSPGPTLLDVRIACAAAPLH